MLKKYITNDFNKNVLKLMTGTTIAQAIPIVISPILTRLYAPDDFGVVALFLAVTTVFGVIANGRYELAIVLPEKDEDAINIVALSLIISIGLSLVLFISIILFKNQIIDILGSKELDIWIYFIPIVVLFIGLYNSLNQLNIRLKTFSLIAKVKVIKSLTLAITQITLGLFKIGSSGLISGQIVSQIFTNSKLAVATVKNKLLMRSIKINKIRKVALTYKEFPLFTLWGTLSNVLTRQLTNIFVSYLYTTATLGHYSLVQRTIGLPSNIIGESIGNVYFQQASRDAEKYGEARKTYISTFKKLLFIGTPAFIILFIVAEELIAFVFSEEWRIAGTYTRYLIPLFYIRFIVSPLSLTNMVFKKQKIDLIWQIILLALSVILFFIAYVLELDADTYFKMYSGVLFLHYLLLLIITYLNSRG